MARPFPEPLIYTDAHRVRWISGPLGGQTREIDTRPSLGPTEFPSPMRIPGWDGCYEYSVVATLGGTMVEYRWNDLGGPHLRGPARRGYWVEHRAEGWCVRSNIPTNNPASEYTVATANSRELADMICRLISDHTHL